MIRSGIGRLGIDLGPENIQSWESYDFHKVVQMTQHPFFSWKQETFYISFTWAEHKLFAWRGVFWEFSLKSLLFITLLLKHSISCYLVQARQHMPWSRHRQTCVALREEASPVSCEWELLLTCTGDYVSTFFPTDFPVIFILEGTQWTHTHCTGFY